MSDKLAFEIDPNDQLCSGVMVELTTEQGRLMDAWPEKGLAIVKEEMLNGQQRNVDGECQHCKATGLIAAKAKAA
ncbi:hypothetical protein [Rheinheimera hassiensis]|uniref:hypothetical protein n=1 Tax=Rheinheimera hassiensis TaxID=1193627 RepID=UPI001F061A6B|nr:hypothetical protein [Rheinheimera hassiensis]